MNPKVSIIVPVYKAEAYLHRCVDSILAQTFRDFEVLLIDDGSPDGSGNICDDYAKKDRRVRVFHNENGGVSSARQCGIDNALGEYTIHADPDDWVEPNMLEQLYNKAICDCSDLVICDYFVDFPSNTHYCKQKPSSLEHETVLAELFQHLHGSCCNKLVKQACYKHYNIRFPKGINYCEDLYTWIILLQYPIRISYLDKAFYHYDNCINPNSISRNYTIKRYEERRHFYATLKADMKSKYKFHCNTLLANIAFEAFRHNIFTNIEYRNLFKKDSKRFLNSDAKIIVKYLAYFSSVGLYKLSLFIYNTMISLRTKIK